MPGESPSPASCPFCGSTSVHRLAPFGRAQLVRPFYCRDCRSVFERIRWEEEKTGESDKFADP